VAILAQCWLAVVPFTISPGKLALYVLITLGGWSV
jgi:hypothetical protein